MKVLRVLKDQELSKEVSKSIEDITLEIKEFCIDLSLTMRYNNGIGISAPQVGVLKRIIVIDVPTKDSRINYIMINPEIMATYGELDFKEGCLSFPKQYVETLRSETITVKWINTAGEQMEETFKGLASAVVQHEIDHLNGLTMFDRTKK